MDDIVNIYKEEVQTEGSDKSAENCLGVRTFQRFGNTGMGATGRNISDKLNTQSILFQLPVAIVHVVYLFFGRNSTLVFL